MASFGEQLRQAREAKQITLQEIAATTKISRRALQALEDEHFDQLPGGIFNKGFVRAYARYVGMDEEKTLASFMAAAKMEGSDSEMQTMSSQVMAARAGARDSGMNATTVVGIVALIVALGLGAVWLREHRREARETAAASAPAPAAPQAPMAAPAGPGTTAGAEGAATAAAPAGVAVTAGPAEGTAQAAAKAGEPAAPVEVTISATKRAWISVRSDGKKVESLTLDPDKPGLSSRTYKAKEKLILVAGNLGGLTVTYNGKPAGTLGGVGEAATITFTAKGMEKQ